MSRCLRLRVFLSCMSILVALLAWSSRTAAQDAQVQLGGGVSDMLIIGPIDPGRGTSPNGQCSDGGRLATTDYLTNADGSVSESNLLVAEGDEVTPDFGGQVDAVGVKDAVNQMINPDAFPDGILTVWRAFADQDGNIDYNLPENLGDPVDDYIIYSLIYLENTTAECVAALLEVGSDDAVKVRFNGALVHVNNVCRGNPGLGSGDRVPVIFRPGVNVVLIAVVERGGGTQVRLVLRNLDDTPLDDGTIAASLEPPMNYLSGGGGWKKLGQPVLESYLASEWKSSAPQQMHT